MDEIVTLKVGAIIQQALLGEAQATRDYSNQLAEIAELSPELADKCAEVIAEIVADELNHENKLHKLFQEITGIAENKE